MKTNIFNIFQKLSISTAALFGVGLVPLMPGTVACLAALPIVLLIQNQLIFAIVTFICVLIAYPVSTIAEKFYRQKDCKKIVIDDFSGMLVTFLFIPHDPRFIITGFFLFRMFDMLKVPPANILEKYSGGKGIVGDDLIAGLYANVILHLARLVIG